MSWQVYSMWVYRIERPAKLGARAVFEASRFIDIPFASDYDLHGSHLQRLSTELRVPLFEGFTMPPSIQDSETAAYFKQLLTRPLAVPAGNDTAQSKLLDAFAPVCAERPGHGQSKVAWAHKAFTENWTAFSKEQESLAMEGRWRFLDRNEWPSVWLTEEVIAKSESLCEEASADVDDEHLDRAVDAGGPVDPVCEDPVDHDAAKPRATMAQYVAIVGRDVALNLEGLALARVEKPKRMYQTDAEIHQHYIETTGGGHAVDDEAGDEVAEAARDTVPTKYTGVFLPIRWVFEEHDMKTLLHFGHKLRPSRLAKDLLALPCFACTPDTKVPDQTQLASTHMHNMRNYAGLRQLSVEDHRVLMEKQDKDLEVNADEGEPDTHVSTMPKRSLPSYAGLPPGATFASQTVFDKPSAFIKELLANLPEKERLTRDQTLFMVKFAEACDQAYEDEGEPPSARRSNHILLLGQGGSGKSHVVQKLVFVIVEFLWPTDVPEEPSLIVVAASNAQAKSISTVDVKARTIHNATCMRVQKYQNANMKPGKKQAVLTRTWDNVRVLVIEEASMVGASICNMLSYRAAWGRSLTHEVPPGTYSNIEGGQYVRAFGRVPIVIFLGDFMQLPPTAMISLIEDVNAKNEDGTYKYAEPPTVEIQHACSLFQRIPHVFELRGTKRFVEGDPLADFLTRMRASLPPSRHKQRFSSKLWDQFAKTFAKDNYGQVDKRHRQSRFLNGHGLAIYWETISRWASLRARRDARALNVPLVFMQAADECNTLRDDNARLRMLEVVNAHNTGDAHGVFLCHEGMRVRFLQKINASAGLVQEQKGTIVDFVFEARDRERYTHAERNGELFIPRFLAAGIWLQLDNFAGGPVYQDLLEGDLVQEVDHGSSGSNSMPCEGGICSGCYGSAPCSKECGHEGEHRCAECLRNARREERARGLYCLSPMESTFSWRSSDVHSVRRQAFTLTHANYMTSTGCQGFTIRTGVTIDCARLEPAGKTGLKEDTWWFHLYVMFSRATRMQDLLLLRPPPKELLEKGPPASIVSALQQFEAKRLRSVAEAEAFALDVGIELPT